MQKNNLANFKKVIYVMWYRFGQQNNMQLQLFDDSELPDRVLPDTPDNRYPQVTDTTGNLNIMSGSIPNMDSIDATLTDYDILPGIREFQLSDFNSDPRDLFYDVKDMERVRDLAEKIRESGRIAPLIVVLEKAGPYILEGAHRLGALHLLGAKTFPAKVVIDKENFDE